MQIETAVRLYDPSTRGGCRQKPEKHTGGRGAGKSERVGAAASGEASSAVAQKVKQTYHTPSNSAPRHPPTGMENWASDKSVPPIFLAALCTTAGRRERPPPQRGCPPEGEG